VVKTVGHYVSVQSIANEVNEIDIIHERFWQNNRNKIARRKSHLICNLQLDAGASVVSYGGRLS
jgi:hypothetical protein